MQARRCLLTRQVWLCNMVTSQCPRSLRSEAEDLAPLGVSFVQGTSRLPQPVLTSPKCGKGSCLPGQVSCLSLGWRKGSCAGPGSKRQGCRQPASAVRSISPCQEQGEQKPCLSFPMHQAEGMERGLPGAGLLAHPEAASSPRKSRFLSGRGLSAALAVAQGCAMGLLGRMGAGTQLGSTAGCSGSGCWELLDQAQREVRCLWCGGRGSRPAVQGQDGGRGGMGRWPRDGSAAEQALPMAASPASSRDAGGTALLPPPAPDTWPLKAQF